MGTPHPGQQLLGTGWQQAQQRQHESQVQQAQASEVAGLPPASIFGVTNPGATPRR